MDSHESTQKSKLSAWMLCHITEGTVWRKKCFGAMSWLCINLSFFSVNALFYALAALLSICTSILILSPLLLSPCQPCNLTQHLKQKRDTLQQAKGLYHPPEWFWISAC